MINRTVSVRPENVILPNGTCVTIRQVYLHCLPLCCTERFT